MNLADLEVLVCLAEEGRFTWAAQKLNRSQPAVSMAVRRLESEFGSRLLGRNSHRVVPTEAGKRVLVMAKHMLQLRENAARDLRDLEGGGQGQLRVIANELLCSYLLPPLLETFHNRSPGVRVEVVQGASSDVLKGLLDQDYDFGFVTFAPCSGELTHRSLFADPLVICVPAGHPLERLPSLTWAHLRCWPILAHSRRTPTRQRLEFQLTQSGSGLVNAMELPSLETLKRFVAGGAGVAILPRLCLARELAEGSLTALPLPGQPITRDIRVAHRRDPRCCPAARVFLDLLQVRYALSPPPQAGLPPLRSIHVPTC
ncbi:LysR family transcriptional regulator [Mesoterricola sediminis]|uniref:LysR family transcriptional regulator n=1 Tax=Mesoterricola sediminis TaxID=2927980 RepID=A0AA48H1B5_9BACT|nr:LysR family transcriptional regulator [Mesoterricola sediminis]BDU78180.1 LysR family transcriptional regulator [Mesoterricola sediminis]